MYYCIFLNQQIWGMHVRVYLHNIFGILEIFLKEHYGRPNLTESDPL